ncbi:tetratricopeptide repeat protein [Anatilimnocola floriformis]|uniref:tetratricopeptide repeat protein n=1 Tax=Anatilimnocola floriformis TaxID=2948575 RepID=UPI0020C30DF3|nr:hypothetical protein [Anatilimnocola floriformis]
MRRTLSSLLIAALFLLLPTLAIACLWDQDTLLAERARFPTTLELITGKFIRHSPEFYEWRVQDRLKKLEKDPENLAWLDDLAVAYDKLGQQDLAIELMERKEKIKPGLYETAANHGTFHAHAGRLEEALPYLRKAIEINPDAHFGREKYQILLIEYSLENPADLGFADFLVQKTPDYLALADQQAAVKGVLGIMRFGNHDNPKVLAALASLLDYGRYELPENDAKALATRAYLKAASLTKDEEQARKWRELAEKTIHRQTDVPLEMAEGELRRELADASEWYAKLRERELGWIKAGVDVDAEFAKLYSSDPAVIQTRKEGSLDHNQILRRNNLRLLTLFVAVVIALVIALVAAIYGAIRAMQPPRVVRVETAEEQA